MTDIVESRFPPPRPHPSLISSHLWGGAWDWVLMGWGMGSSNARMRKEQQGGKGAPVNGHAREGCFDAHAGSPTAACAQRLNAGHVGT